jgi:hypothetical protein
MLTWGLLVIIVNVVYLLLSMLIGYLAYKFFKDKYRHIGKIVFIVVLLAPFWDLIIQKGVKTYYQAFKIEGEIYAYPEVDADGKIESLDITRKSGYKSIGWFVNSINKQEITYKNFPLDFFYIDKFKKTGFDDSNIEKNLRIRFDDIKPQFEYIENGNARYKIEEKKENHFFDLYSINEYLLIDNKTNKVLAKDLLVSFYNKDENKFRNKYLLWVSGNGIPFNISQIKSSVIKEKILKINYFL